MKKWIRKTGTYETMKKEETHKTTDTYRASEGCVCPYCGTKIRGGEGWVSHLIVPDEGKHDEMPAYIICKSCMDKELAEEKEIIEGGGAL